MLKVTDVVTGSLVGAPVASPLGLVPAGMYPAGWQETRVDDTVLVAHGSVIAEVAPLLERGATLHDWARRQPGAEPMQGRRTAWAVTLADSATAVVVRHSAHGGTLAALTGDRFVRPRAGDELRLSWTLRQVGIATPRVLAFALYPALGRMLWRADVMTQRVPDAQDLVAALRPADEAALVPLVAAAETLLERMRASQVLHPDLNCKNVLLTPTDDATPQPWLLDVDTVRFAHKDAGARNRARLIRSAHKWARKELAPSFRRFAMALERNAAR